MLIHPGAQHNWLELVLGSLSTAILAIGVLLDRLERVVVVRWWFESGNLFSHLALLLFYRPKGVTYQKGARYGRAGLRGEEEILMVRKKVA